MATEGFVCWTECDGDIGPCQYITNRGGGIDFIARVNTVTKPSDATLITLQSAGSFLGIDCNIYRVVPIAPTVSTTTTTVAPISLTLTASCIGTGINGTGRIVANGFTGGTGTYANIRLGNTLSAALGATPIVLGGASSYQWDSLLNQTYYVVLTDSGNNSNYATVSVNCTNTTTTTSTSTTSTSTTSTSTTSTTTLAPICTYNGGTAVVVYPSTTTTSTTQPPTTTTTSTSTTSTSTSTTTTTTEAPTYDFYIAEQYACGERNLVGTATIAFPTGTPINYDRFYNSDTDIGIYAYQPVEFTEVGPGLIMNTIAYITIPLACPV
jgi:hypothetical protein